jgi:hypothetical protein
MKEFNLSDKRKELYLKLCKSEGTMKVLALASIFQRIEQQDKEFIKRLKECVDVLNDGECQQTPNDLLRVIDSLAGDKLSQTPQTKPLKAQKEGKRPEEVFVMATTQDKTGEAHQIKKEQKE